MRKTFAKNPGPMLAGVVRERNVRDAIAAIRNCEVHGATGIDLHLSCLEHEYQNVESIRRIVESTRLPILALNYNGYYDYTSYPATEEDRIGLMMMGLEAGASGIDLQGYSYDLESKAAFRGGSASGHSFAECNPKEVVLDEAIIEKQMALIDRIHSMGAEVLFSTHTGCPMSTRQVVDLALFLEKRNPDIIKIVTIADTEEQMAEAFRTMVALKKEVKTPVGFHCGGKCGRLTRIVNPMLGSYMVFCIDRYTASSDLNQVDLQAIRTILDNTNRLL